MVVSTDWILLVLVTVVVAVGTVIVIVVSAALEVPSVSYLSGV